MQVRRREQTEAKLASECKGDENVRRVEQAQAIAKRRSMSIRKRSNVRNEWACVNIGQPNMVCVMVFLVENHSQGVQRFEKPPNPSCHIKLHFPCILVSKDQELLCVRKNVVGLTQGARFQGGWLRRVHQSQKDRSQVTRQSIAIQGAESARPAGPNK